MPSNIEALDLISTSQTFFSYIDTLTGEKRITQDRRCIYGAPLIAMIFRGNASIRQACCNHWDCPACGIVRAKQEYHKMVWGAQCLADAGHDLYFYTFTCRGKEMPLETAEENYYEWTNLLLTKMRAKSKRRNDYWAYAQATERQKRLHPHSHLLSTFIPDDAIKTTDSKGRELVISAWFTKAHYDAGLGTEHRISRADNIEATARYIAKYLFKDTALTQWPPKWKRVRYGENWPDPPYIPAEIAITLRTESEWRQAARIKETFTCESELIYERAIKRMANIRKRQSDVDF